MSARLGYYPGCSQSSTAAEYDISTRACCKALGLELFDVPDWTCCGSTPAGFDRVTTPCPSCLSALKTAGAHLNGVQGAGEIYRAKVEALLGRPAPGPVDCQSTLQVLFEQIGPEGVKARVKRPLAGLRVAPYYGCILNRPPGLMAFDDPENPIAMDRLLEACGAEIVDFPFKTECCGAAFGMPRLNVMQRLSARILDMAESTGADCIAVACPLCQMNLDLRRGQVNSASGRNITMPVPFFTQLLGLALGLPEAELCFGKLVLPLSPALAAAEQREASRAAEAEAKAAAKAVKNGTPRSEPVCKEDAPCA